MLAAARNYGQAIEAIDTLAATEGEPIIVRLSEFAKARPIEEAGERFVECEVSNENWDAEREKIRVGALLGSSDLYLSKGNIDIDHLTMLGLRMGIANPREWEIGVPVKVWGEGKSVWMRGRIYKGGPTKADWFWGTLHQDPPMRWFPSVGGIPTEHKMVLDPRTGQHRKVIVAARWVNTAFAREPINLSVSAVRTVTADAFGKAVEYALGNAVECECDGRECHCTAKAITAGYGTDSAALSGGGALRLQSIQGRVLAPWKEPAARFLRSVGTGKCPHTRADSPMDRDQIVNHFVECEGVDESAARRMTARLLTHVSHRLRRAPA